MIPQHSHRNCVIEFDRPDEHPGIEKLRDLTLPHSRCPALARNIFSTERDPTDPAKRFCGTGNLLQTVQEMAPLAQAMCRPGIRKTGVAAGYTYLAQLVAHDMAVLAGGTDVGAFDYQSKSPDEEYLRPLSLGSLYGQYHPPDRYAFLRQGARDGKVRLYRFPDSVVDPQAPPAFDFVYDNDGEAIVRDVRNQDTPILSQIAALFFAFHNTCASRLRKRIDGEVLFDACRQLTVETYHEIIRKDLLTTLLHPNVRRHYDAEGILVDKGATLSSLPSVEFMHGVFRFGHAMVQPSYKLTPNGGPLLLTDLLRGLNNVGQLRDYDPGFWKVDWRMFFGPDAQLSGALAPSFAPVFAEVPDLLDSEAKEIRISAEHGGWRNDLVMRDLARSADSGLSSVRHLVEHLRPLLSEDESLASCLSFDDKRREGAIQDWCSGAFPQGLPSELSSFLTSDPPLCFYTLLEASLPVEDGGGGGRHLGTLGSVLTAEAVFAALEASGDDFRTDQRVRTLRSDVFADDDSPTTMAELISFLSEKP